MILGRLGRATAVVCLAAALGPAAASAQGARPDAASRAGGNRPRIEAKLAERAPQIDGSLDDPIWQNAAHIDTLVQQRPVEGAPASEKTDLYIAYDKDTLY